MTAANLILHLQQCSPNAKIMLTVRCTDGGVGHHADYSSMEIVGTRGMLDDQTITLIGDESK